MALSSSRLATETSILSDLIVSIKKGEVKIPQFQRKFVWKEQQAIELLDSISNNYPVGSLLLWRTSEKLKAERNIGEFRLPETDDHSPTDYVLDGQQRLTVIYSCLGAPEDETGFVIVYDLLKKEFQKAERKLEIHQFPLRKIFITTQLLNYRTALLAHGQAGTLQQTLDELVSSITSYRIPVVTLKDLTISEVCPIFERINSSGTKLSTYDLMVAATWSKDFDLDTKVESVCESLRPKGYGDIEKSSVLKCLSAIHLGTIKEDSLKSLRDLSATDLNTLLKKTTESLEKTVDLFSTEFMIHSWDFLSYEALLIVTASIFSKHPRLTADSVVRLRQWFWRSSFGERYKVGGANFVSKDLGVVSDFVINSKGKKEDFGNPLNEDEWETVAFKSNVSRTRAYILALAKQKPLDIVTGLTIDTATALSIFNKKQFHHVHPRAFLKAIGEKMDHNLMANICILPMSSNNEISDKDPKSYFSELIAKHNRQADNIFQSNLLPLTSDLDYSKATYKEFIDSRKKTLKKAILELCEGQK